tara:strand:+ start:7732 stop:7944 length:213 start_codon:yes stop_codon:yes gene_type:complete
MGAVKAMCMDIEEKCWDKVADVIGECEHVTEAYGKAKDIFKAENILGYIDAEMIEEGVDEMWNEFWSKYL